MDFTRKFFNNVVTLVMFFEIGEISLIIDYS